jgi:hypothetical protein
VSYHVSGFTPGNVEDIPKLKAVWADFVHALDELSGSTFEGVIAGGDWIGDNQKQANAFTLSAAAVRAEKDRP